MLFVKLVGCLNADLLYWLFVDFMIAGRPPHSAHFADQCRAQYPPLPPRLCPSHDHMCTHALSHTRALRGAPNHSGLEFIRGVQEDEALFEEYAFPTTVPGADGKGGPPVVCGPHVTPQTRDEYVRRALRLRLHEFDAQMAAVRRGMARVVPMPLLCLFTPAQLEHLVCGSPDFSLDLLRSTTKYKGCAESSCYVEWFWSCMAELSLAECAMFLRFVWGRARLPRSESDFNGKNFILQVLYLSPCLLFFLEGCSLISTL